MGKLEALFKSETVRLARKEIRAACGPVAKTVRELKRTVAALRKTVAAMEKTVAELQAQAMAEKTDLVASEEEVQAARTSPGLIKKLRTRLDLSQRELADLLGVSTTAVAFWEQGRSRPHGKNRQAIVALRKLGKREVKRLLAHRQGECATGAPRPAHKATQRRAKNKAKRKKAKRRT